MKSTHFLVPTLAVVFLAGGKDLSAQQYYGPPLFACSQHDAEEAWEQRGFYDGRKGAEYDFWNHRRPNVNNREEYRDPDSVPGLARYEYREGFRRDTTSECNRSITADAATMISAVIVRRKSVLVELANKQRARPAMARSSFDAWH